MTESEQDLTAFADGLITQYEHSQQEVLSSLSESQRKFESSVNESLDGLTEQLEIQKQRWESVLEANRKLQKINQQLKEELQAEQENSRAEREHSLNLYRQLSELLSVLQEKFPDLYQELEGKTGRHP